MNTDISLATLGIIAIFVLLLIVTLSDEVAF